MLSKYCIFQFLLVAGIYSRPEGISPKGGTLNFFCGIFTSLIKAGQWLCSLEDMNDSACRLAIVEY